MSHFQSILDALDQYAEHTGINLNQNPFADKLKDCDSPGAVLLLLQQNLKAFKDYRDRNRKFIDILSPVVQFVHAFSGALGEAASIVPFPPAKLIFVGIDILFTAAGGVSASYDALLELFECIGNFLKRLQVYTNITLSPLMTDIIAKIMAELICVLALAKKQIRQGRLRQFAKKLLGNTEIEGILRRLDRLTLEEARMAEAQILEVVHGLMNNMKVVMDGGEGSTNAIRKTLVTMQDVVNEINRMKRDRLHEESMGWLSPPDPSKNHVIARGDCHDGSVTWFTKGDTFEKWNATGCLLWINGKPGSGKSILCSTIIEEIKGRRDAGLGLLAYFYFDFRDTKKRDIRGLLSSLLTQLCVKSDPCYQILSDLYSTHDAGSQQPDTKALVRCLNDMLELPGQPTIYFVMDALDECPNDSGVVSPREKVLNFIEDLVELHLPNLRICVTSRSEADILDVLESLASYTVCLHDEDGQKKDITDCINSVVQSDRKMRRWRVEERQMVIDALTQRADGMFRWVFCQLETLRRCFPIAIRSTLDKLPQTLDETYERTLLGIEKERRIYAHRLFQCLTTSIRPLRVEELAEVLAVQFDVGRDSEYSTEWRPGDAQHAVLSACSSLITVVNVEGSQVVQFAHFSVKEFLTSNRLRLSNAGESLSRYHVPLLSAHIVLARASLSVLLSLDGQVDKSTVEKRPLCIYAARHWVDHAKIDGVSSSIQDLMKRLFDPDRPYFVTWVWIYDVDRPWKGYMATVHPTQPEAESLYYAALCGLRSLVDHLTLTHPTYVNARGGVHGTPLNAALIKEEVETALALLENGANINALGRAGGSPLHSAALAGRYAVVKLLLEHQANINIQIGDEERKTPLHLVAQAGQLEVCQLLLRHGADVAIRDENGRTSLFMASQYGHLDIVQDLLVYGADANAQDDNLWTPLHLASFEGHLEIVQLLVHHSAVLDNTNVDQETALHVASRGSGKHKIAHFLIEQGANPMSKDNDGDTPLHNASRHGHLDLVEIFLAGGVNVNARNADEETPLDLASGCGNLDIVSFLIKREADVNCCDKQGWTPLHTATRNGHSDIVRLLLNHRADVNSTDDEGWTSLHLAARNGYVDVVQLLLDHWHGADVHVQKPDLWSPLHLASANGHLKVAELLIENGAEIDVRNDEQKTSLYLASGNGNFEVARLLVKCGSNVNSQDREGWTPSHSAAWNGHLSLVELLVDSGADVGMQNNNQKTPLDLSQENGKSDVTSFLARRSGSVCALNTVNPTSLEAESKYSLPEVAEPQLYSSGPSDDEECNSLHGALVNGRLDLVQKLLDRGADVNERDNLLKTPLEVTSRSGMFELAKTLIKFGADVNPRDTLGRTPLHMATQYGHVDIARLLLHNGADINATHWEGGTALHIASIGNHTEMVQLLLEWGANVQIRCVFGKTPLQYASTYGNREVVQLLSEYSLGGL